MLLRCLNYGLCILNKHHEAIIKARLFERVEPIIEQETKYGGIKFYCPGDIPLWRAETLLTKEPETIQWIDGFDCGDIFWDIGANIGCYTMYAAMRELNVCAFEPSAGNYYILNKNIQLNDFHEYVKAFCVAFSEENSAGLLNMTMTDLGGAVCEFGNRQNKVHFVDESREVVFRQGMIAYSIDEFCRYFDLDVPNHIKIDVDGIEDKIVIGAQETLRSPQLRSVLIELDTKDTGCCERVMSITEKAGLELESKKHSERYVRGKYSTIYNHIFVRASSI